MRPSAPARRFGVTGAPLQVNLGKVRDHIVAATEADCAATSRPSG